MTGLLLIVSEATGDRFAAAIDLAAATAALGRPVALHLRGPAVATLGLAPVAQALDLLLEMGAEISACQTALATHGVAASTLPPGIHPSGLVAFLAHRADWQVTLV